MRLLSGFGGGDSHAFSRRPGTPRRMPLSSEGGRSVQGRFAVLPAWSRDVTGVKAFTYHAEQRRWACRSHSKILLFVEIPARPPHSGRNSVSMATAAVAALAADMAAQSEATARAVGKMAPHGVAQASVRRTTIGLWDEARRRQRRWDAVKGSARDAIRGWRRNRSGVRAAEDQWRGSKAVVPGRGYSRRAHRFIGNKSDRTRDRQ